jgi:hypothetical protein
MATHPRTRSAPAPRRDRRGGEPQRPVAQPPVDPRLERPLHPTDGGPPLDPVEPARSAGWRDTVISLSGLNVIAGIWLIVAPWVLNYRAGDPKWNDVVFGAAIAILALTRVGGALRESWISVVNALIGVWLFVAAFTIDASRTAGWNDVILGVIVFVLALASASASEDAAEARRV